MTASKKSASSAHAGDLRGDAVEQLAQTRVKLGEVVIVGIVENPGLQRSCQRREPVAVQQPSKQRGVVRTVDDGGLDVQGGGTADVVQYCRS